MLLIFQLLQAILPLIALYLTKLIVDAVTLSVDSLDFQVVFRYILYFGGIQLAMAILRNYQQLITETQQQLVSDYMSEIIIEKAIAVDLSYYENAAFHDTFHQTQKESMFRPIQILRNLTELLRTSFLLVSLAGLLFFLHWSIGFILLAFALPIAGVKWYYSKKMYTWKRQRISLEREAAYLNEVLTTDTYAKEVRIFNLGTYLKEKFIKVRKALFIEKYKIGQQQVRAGLLAQGSEILALTATYGFIAWRTVQGSITIGDLVMYFQAFQKGQVAIQQALQSVVSLYNNRLFLSHLFELLHVQSLLKIPENPSVPAPLKQSIALKNVDFTYPRTEKQVLSNINLNLRKGQVIALVGENGSGKTSLVKLLCRLYDPTEGGIYWDGEDIRNFKLSDWSEKNSVIYQDFAKYHFSAAENIRIGDWHNQRPEEDLHLAAKKSGAASFIENFPKQYDQQLGRKFKKGAELSGGQWQKIALARAFYKEAEVIILDEPSSAIDPLAEAEIFEHFRVLAKDKILILVTHRLYNLKIADKIVVLDGGRVIEQGTHEELVAMGGTYLAMFEKQT